MQTHMFYLENLSVLEHETWKLLLGLHAKVLDGSCQRIDRIYCAVTTSRSSNGDSILHWPISFIMRHRLNGVYVYVYMNTRFMWAFNYQIYLVHFTQSTPPWEHTSHNFDLRQLPRTQHPIHRVEEAQLESHINIIIFCQCLFIFMIAT